VGYVHSGDEPLASPSVSELVALLRCSLRFLPLGWQQNRKCDAQGFARLPYIELETFTSNIKVAIRAGEARVLARSILFDEELFDETEARSAGLPVGVCDPIDVGLVPAIDPERRERHGKEF